ncbi:MAG: 4-alpha-glucanotransferase [Dorea sp.]
MDTGPGMESVPYDEETLSGLQSLRKISVPDRPDETIVKRQWLSGNESMNYVVAGETVNYLPHNYDKNCVVYTGTHDNDTLQGWYQTLSEDKR